MAWNRIDTKFTKHLHPKISNAAKWLQYFLLQKFSNPGLFMSLAVPNLLWSPYISIRISA